MGSDLRSFPMEREWESADTTAIQAVLFLLDPDGGAPASQVPADFVASAEAEQDRVVLAEEDGVATSKSALAGVEGRWGRLLGPRFRIQAGLQIITDHRSGAVEKLQIAETGVAWEGERHRWALGRTKLRWGAGASGSLLAGGTAPPRWQVRWRTERALRVPTFGWAALDDVTWTGSFFLAHLDDTFREIDDPLLLGHRLSVQPWSWFAVTGTRTILFGGAGRTSRLDAGGILDILLARNENLRGDRPPSDSDQRASLELRLRPNVSALGTSWEGLELFWEYAGEDINRLPLPSAVAHQMGLMTRVGGWTLLVEGVETITGVNRWYDHVVYGQDAYAYRQFLLGHSLGADARMRSGTVWSPPGRTRGRIRFEREEFGFFRSERGSRSTYELAVRTEFQTGVGAELILAHTSADGSLRVKRAPGWAHNQVELRFDWAPRGN